MENAINMECMLHDCSSLSNVADMSKWNTINIINMEFLFCRCSSLSNLPDISKLNTTTIINAANMNICFINAHD